VRTLRRFYLQLFQFTAIGVALFAVNLVVNPDTVWLCKWVDTAQLLARRLAAG